MSAIEVPPGWHPDPADPASSYRWWDGMRWTEHTRQVGGTAPGYATQPPAVWSGQGTAQSNPAGSPWGTNGYTHQPPQPFLPANPSVGRRNQGSFTAIGVAALYVIIALATHVVFFGIVPAAAAVRAFKRREPLAPVAAVAAGVAIVVAFASLAH